jgi:pimeloyl-ACP methyl ester carboxylesterase
MATYVLVHGAYQGGWIWKPVAQRLRAAGHEVYAPTLEGCAERHEQVRVGITVGTHAHEVARLLFYEDLKDVVLVGTSSGGMVICRVAELAEDRIARLVFVDALALLPAERVADIVSRPNANVVTEMTTAPTRADAEGRMFADLEPATRAWVLARYTPHPVDALEAPMAPSNFWERPWKAAVIRCRQARNPPMSHQRRTAERLKASYTEMDTGHYPMVSQPDELTRLLMSST